MNPIDEKVYVQQAAAGDADAFEYLLRQYQSQIYNLCLRLTGNREDAADMTQEAFLRAWNGLARFQFEAAFSTWLYRLASNVCLDHLRALKRRPKVSLTVEDEEGKTQELSITDDAPTPEEAVIRVEENARLQQAMQALEPEQRQILTLRAINGLSYTDIAAILEVKEGTVKSRLARAQDALRKKYNYFGNYSIFAPSNQKKGGTSS